MSVQFGIANFDGRPIAIDSLPAIAATLAPYAPNGLVTTTHHGACILFGLLCTHNQRKEKIGPRVTLEGSAVTWTGRLDNRSDLLSELGNSLNAESPDEAIVAAAYAQWGAKSLARILGDWVLSVWDPCERTLTLAKDFLGSQPLFYLLTPTSVAWSSILEPLLLLTDGPRNLDLEYLAGWLSLYPATDRTPFAAICSVPPASALTIQSGSAERKGFWNFDGHHNLRYRTDREYEEHFRALLAQSVKRRLRSIFPVLAELSGGMDSSSIVCVADTLFARGEAETPRIDTVSFRADSEPDWDEAPFFTAVEQQRGRKGFHIALDPEAIFRLEPSDVLSAVPGSEFQDHQAHQRLEQCMLAEGYRVVLSGLGGDEVLGGVPTPIPELEDLLARGHFLELAQQLKIWALAQRKPWIHLFGESARGFLPAFLRMTPPHQRSAFWLRGDFMSRYRNALSGYPSRLKFLGPLPSFQENEATLAVLRRQIGSRPLPHQPPHERRYPLLDQDLLSFLYAIPREQLVRPGERRSLLRRALAGIVPNAVLGRRRKAFAATGVLRQLSKTWPQLMLLTVDMRASALGIVDPARFRNAFERARNGEEVSLPLLLRTLSLELWLRRLDNHSLPSVRRESPNATDPARRAPNSFSAEKICEERRLAP